MSLLARVGWSGRARRVYQRLEAATVAAAVEDEDEAVEDVEVVVVGRNLDVAEVGGEVEVRKGRRWWLRRRRLRERRGLMSRPLKRQTGKKGVCTKKRS